ncbi:MAG: DUF2157 domain-containing protein [Hyphomonadaceae bacterium]
MAGYKERLTGDLDRWIGAGLVDGAKRDAILDTVPDTRRLDAATAMAWIGGLLLGVAVIAFVAANWDQLSRITRFAALVALFLTAASGAALAAHRVRPMTSDILLTFAALVFSASIGLTGQIFDIAGDPRFALYASGVAAALLAIAGRSTGAAMASLILIGWADLNTHSCFSSFVASWPLSVIAGPAGALFALRWRSAPLAHVASLSIIYAFAWVAFEIAGDSLRGGAILFLSVWLAVLSGAARWMRSTGHAFASVFYGWFAWAALVFFAASGFDGDGVFGQAGIVHRVLWLALSACVIALGRFDRHALVTAGGVLSLIGAIAGLLMDLGLDLMAAAGVFFVCALVALVAGLALRRRAKP